MQTTTRGECPGDPAHVQMRPGARWSPLISDVPDCEQEVCLLIAIWKSLLPGFMSLFPWLIFHIASMFDFKEHIYLSYSPGQVLCVPPSMRFHGLSFHTLLKLLLPKVLQLLIFLVSEIQKASHGLHCRSEFASVSLVS